MFASPLNSSCISICSLFYDTDFFFGSHGPFFNFEPRDTGGSFEVSDSRFRTDGLTRTIADFCACFGHILDIFENCAIGNPLSFIIVVNQIGPDLSAIIRDKRVSDKLAPYLRTSLTARKGGHDFLFGLQHRRDGRRNKDGSAVKEWKQDKKNTSVFILQNVAGASYWPVTPFKCKLLLAHFHTKMPTVRQGYARIRESHAEELETYERFLAQQEAVQAREAEEWLSAKPAITASLQLKQLQERENLALELAKFTNSSVDEATAALQASQFDSEEAALQILSNKQKHDDDDDDEEEDGEEREEKEGAGLEGEERGEQRPILQQTPLTRVQRETLERQQAQALLWQRQQAPQAHERMQAQEQEQEQALKLQQQQEAHAQEHQQTLQAQAQKLVEGQALVYRTQQAQQAASQAQEAQEAASQAAAARAKQEAEELAKRQAAYMAFTQVQKRAFERVPHEQEQQQEQNEPHVHQQRAAEMRVGKRHVELRKYEVEERKRKAEARQQQTQTSKQNILQQKHALQAQQITEQALLRQTLQAQQAQQAYQVCSVNGSGGIESAHNYAARWNLCLEWIVGENPIASKSQVREIDGRGTDTYVCRVLLKKAAGDKKSLHEATGVGGSKRESKASAALNLMARVNHQRLGQVRQQAQQQAQQRARHQIELPRAAALEAERNEREKIRNAIIQQRTSAASGRMEATRQTLRGCAPKEDRLTWDDVFSDEEADDEDDSKGWGLEEVSGAPICSKRAGTGAGPAGESGTSKTAPTASNTATSDAERIRILCLAMGSIVRNNGGSMESGIFGSALYERLPWAKEKIRQLWLAALPGGGSSPLRWLVDTHGKGFNLEFDVSGNRVRLRNNQGPTATTKVAGIGKCIVRIVGKSVHANSRGVAEIGYLFTNVYRELPWAEETILQLQNGSPAGGGCANAFFIDKYGGQFHLEWVQGEDDFGRTRNRVRLRNTGAGPAGESGTSKTAAPALPAQQQGGRQGEWTCTSCGNLNYAFRTACNRCKVPKGGAVPGTATGKECLQRLLFGSPKGELAQMRRHITPATPLFLLNIRSGEILGVFFSTGPPSENIVPEAWQKTGQGRTFPAQLRVRWGPIKSRMTATKPQTAKGGDFSTGPRTAQQTALLFAGLGTSAEEAMA
eukprot:g851.t1